MTLVRLDAIAVDAGTQVRARLDEAVVAEYAERMTEGDVFPPLVVFTDGTCNADGSPRYYLGDGFHRTMAARKNGFLDLDADVRVGTKSDALWHAAGANKCNGLQMTHDDKKHAVMLMIQAFADKSMHQIAAQVGCAYSYVHRLKGQVVTSDHLPAKVTGKDGKSYPASRRTEPRMELTGDKTKDTQLAIQTYPNKSGRQIAAMVGCDQSYVARIRSEAAPLFKSRAAVNERHGRIRQMAADGYSVHQIAGAVGLGEQACRKFIRDEAIDVPASRVMGNTRRHNSTRIIEHMVMDAENLTTDVSLINFSDIDHVRLAAWIDALTASKRALHAFIQRLLKEQQKHGQAA